MKLDLNRIAEDWIFEFLVAEYGQRLVADSGGNVYLEGEGTFSTDEVASASCPGLGNMDSGLFTEGFVEWDEEREAYVVVPPHDDAGRVVGGLEDVIKECCEYGDMVGFVDDLAESLHKSMEGSGWVFLDDELVDFESAAVLMDDEIRERLHLAMAPCTDQEFVDAYVKAHRIKYGEEFLVN
jgi:hypothetical protein